MTASRVPTRRELVRFLALINQGRRALGLREIKTLDFDACTPGRSGNCLSARHLLTPAQIGDGWRVYREIFLVYDPEKGERLAVALGTRTTFYASDCIVVIPAGIKAVTDRFDALRGAGEAEFEAWRVRLRECGMLRRRSGRKAAA